MGGGGGGLLANKTSNNLTKAVCGEGRGSAILIKLACGLKYWCPFYLLSYLVVNFYGALLKLAYLK